MQKQTNAFAWLLWKDLEQIQIFRLMIFRILILLFVTDMDSFTSDDKWLDIFGERLILQKPEDMELFPAVEKGFSYLMLFTDDVKIDLTFFAAGTDRRVFYMG